MEDELIVTQVVAPELPAVSEPAATGELPPGQVNQPPDPEALKGEIERLEKVRKEAEEKALYWRKQKAESRADYFKDRGEPPVRPPADDLGMGQEPKQEAFDDYQKYLDAKISFEVNKAKITWDRDQSRKAQEQTHQQKLTILHEKLEEGFRKYPDFEEIAMDRTVPITPVIMDILAESERPHDLAYYLGRNRAEAIRISRLTPIQATREIAKIEAKLDEAGGDLPPPSKPIIPGAPPPIRPVGSSHTVERSFEKMSQKEFETEMQKRLGRRY